MKEERKVALVLQGRMNSTRVPNKMIRPFAGSNLFQLALDKIATSKVINPKDVFIAVGEDPLIEMASKTDFNIFLRTQKGCDSTNDPNVPDSLMLLYEWYDHLINAGYTHVVLISACNPLLSIDTINEFYSTFSEVSLDGMFSVTKESNFFWDMDGKTITDWKGMKLMNTRKIDPVYMGAHCMYGSGIDFIKNECWMGNTSPPEPEMFEVSGLEATDIDTLEDFEIAEVLYRHYNPPAKPAEMAKDFLDPKRNKSGLNPNVGIALSHAHDEIKAAIEIAYYEGLNDLENVYKTTINYARKRYNEGELEEIDR